MQTLRICCETGLSFEAKQSYPCPMPIKGHVYSHAVWRILTLGDQRLLIQTTTATQVEPRPNNLIELRPREANRTTENHTSKTNKKEKQ
jgi:hypothetical protein